LLEYRENKTSIRSTLLDMLDQSGITLNNPNTPQNDLTSSSGLMLEHFRLAYIKNNRQGEPKLQLSHYIELVEQVGRLT